MLWLKSYTDMNDFILWFDAMLSQVAIWVDVCPRNASANDTQIDIHLFRHWLPHDSHCPGQLEQQLFCQRSANVQAMLHLRLVLSTAAILVCVEWPRNAPVPVDWCRWRLHTTWNENKTKILSFYNEKSAQKRKNTQFGVIENVQVPTNNRVNCPNAMFWNEFERIWLLGTRLHFKCYLIIFVNEFAWNFFA